MVFKRIELNGFKSFADPVVIEFTDGITCIVGPNGSGKSNISDAIRWVLGEQSPKMLRGGKMEEVIFAGTQSRKPKGMAEVTIVLDNSEGVLPIDFSEVAITRRMYRSGESEYQINRSPCRLKDIRELIMDTGMGVEGYSIIGQGKIADIVSNKMESRREIFEEAAGIVKYRSKKAESERKLENASGNLDRVNDIIGEIRGRIDGLADDSRRAEEYLVLRDQYKEIEINITLKSIDSVSGKNEAIQQELLELNAAVAGQKSGRELLENQLRQKRKDAQDLEAQTESLRDALTALSEEIHAISNRKELNRERLASLSRELDRLEGERSILKEKVQREEANARELQSAREDVDKESQVCNATLEEKEKTVRTISALLNTREEELQHQKDRLFELTGKKAAGQSEIDSMLSLKSTLTKRASQLESEGSLSDETDKAYATELEKARSVWNEKNQRSRELESEIRSFLTQQTELSSEEAGIGRKLSELALSVGRMKTRKKLLEELESAYEGYGGSVQFLMRRRLRGVIGVVGELLQVPKGLEIAVETALGASLQNIVCRDDACAKEAIALLKANQAGRLTFLPLESIRTGRPTIPEKLKSAKGFLGGAADRITCDGGADQVLDYLLGRVILCQDLDCATAMSGVSEGGFRFVTLQGDIINPAGAITGGSLRSNTGNILSRKAEIEELSGNIQSAEGEILTAQKEQKRVGEQLENLLQRLRRAEAALRETEKDCAVKSSEIQQMESLANHAAISSQKRLLEQADLNREILRVDESVAALHDTTESMQEEIEALNQSTADLYDGIKDIKSRLSEATEEETKARMALSNVKVRIQSADALEKRVEDALRQLREEAAQKDEACSEAEQQIRHLSEPAESGASSLKEKEEERQKMEVRLSELQKLRHEALRASEAMDAERSAYEQELYGLQMRQREAEVKLAKFETQMETLKEKLWEEFEMSYVQAMEFEKEEFIMSKALKESREIKDRMRTLGDVNIGAIKEYQQVRQRYDFLREQQEDLTKAIDELNAIIEDMDTTIRKRFKESFDAVVDNFEAAFTDLFGGGHARLSLDDPSKPLESGIEIEAQPPGKKLQNINLLSGGEKTMTAIALMFAVLKAKPTPFCILDEVEAALDDTNIDSFARYLHKFRQTQFALVTHQKATMEYADVLYGITMPEQGISKVLSLKLGDSFEI
ncbi:MAG: chromosome segregation protein SMC [Eubacteriales bacterium]|nr:chromosome segregation protein SMC [Eubacteriales bacterium]MDD3290071.1 chromosome segregation protein SMC [Eubacteriales bacterium]